MRLFHGGLASGFCGLPIVILEQQRSETSPQVPLDIVGQHAEEDVSADMVLAVDMDRADGQSAGLETAECPCDLGQALVSFHCLIGSHVPETGSDHVDTIELSLLRDAGKVAGPGQRSLGDGELKMLLHPHAMEFSFYSPADGCHAAKRTAGTMDGRSDGFQPGLGEVQQFVPLTTSVLPKPGVETDQQSLTWKIWTGQFCDPILDQLTRVQKGGLVFAARLGELADAGISQRTDPVQVRRFRILTNPGGCDHAPVPNQDQSTDTKPSAYLFHLGRHGGRVRAVAREDLHRHRTTVRRTQQPEQDLTLAPFAVSIMSEGCQRTAPAFQITAADVIQNQGIGIQMSAGQATFNPALPSPQPIQYRQQLIALDLL